MATKRSRTERAWQSALAIYARWEAERDRIPLDRIVAAEFRSRRFLNAGERRWVAEAIYGTVRFLRRQTFLLERRGQPVTPENLIGLWEDLTPPLSDLPPDPLPKGKGSSSTKTLPLLGEPASDLGKGELAGGRSSPLPTPDSPRDYLRIALSFPDAMAESLEELLGSEAVVAAEAFNAPAPVTLRVNPLRATLSQTQTALPEAVPTRWSPWGLTLPGRVNAPSLPGFREGWFEIQEEASQLAALLTDARPGQTLVEVGAGAGGKTLALAALMQGQGRLVALDTAASRLEELRRRARRAGVSNIEVLPLRASEAGIWARAGNIGNSLKALRGTADCVLVDAPCTGSGVLRRSPDAKWRQREVPAFARLQGRLLRQAAELVAPGGRLVYVTCAFEWEQNEAVIETFLTSEAGRAFTVEPAAPRLASAILRASALAALPTSRRARKRLAAEATPLLELDRQTRERCEHLMAGPYLRTWPHRHGLDAFFAASLVANHS